MLIELSTDFKKKSKSTIFSIFIFVIVYFLLFLAAIGLAATAVFLGIKLVLWKPTLITLIIGIGITGIGIIVIYFLVKFLFQKHIENRSHLTEITKQNEPELYKLIEEIATEVQTKFPKKVYISHGVNASVFYDSSFWSMFMPIEKNLTIGLGLVNACTRQELKAIISHEFGHFSQKSMTVGSYVYNVNKIIFNMLQDDTTFDNTVKSWASVNDYFNTFVKISVGIINGIRFILDKMYGYVNIRYMGLSREMEFHADEVAANIAGSLPLEESLLRMDIASSAYNTVIDFYNNKLENKELFKAASLYQQQSFVMNFFAKDNDLKQKYDLPFVDLETASLFNKSKLKFQDQWASHPSDEDRITRLRALNIIKEYDDKPATSLFINFEKTDQYMTEKLFGSVKNFKNLQPLDLENFKEEFTNDYQTKTHQPIFNKYFDFRTPIKNTESTDIQNGTEDFNQLFSQEKMELINSEATLMTDILKLYGLQEQNHIKTFDYDGEKYTIEGSNNLIEKLENEKEQISEQVLNNDKEIYNYFYHISLQQNINDKFLNHYESLAEIQDQLENNYELISELSNQIQSLFFDGNYKKLNKKISSIKEIENTFKAKIKNLLLVEIISNDFKDDDRKDLEYYANNDLIYFQNDEFLEKNIELVFTVINLFDHYTTQLNNKLIKKLVDFLASIEHNKRQY